jgi:hypothetical protein
MNWKIAMLEFAELGALLLVLWIPLRMGRAGIRNLWCTLTGWFVLAVITLALEIVILPLSSMGNNGVDSDLTRALPNKLIVIAILFFGWIPAWTATTVGKNRQRK